MFISIRAKIFLVLSICLVLAAAFIYAQTDRRHINNNSVVLISSVGCRSAETRTVGTIIDGGFILTVAHGVAGQNANRIIFADGETTQASIAVIDSNLDLALLKFDQAPLRSPV
ncbi:MAG: serine protease, partial [Actinobacteria bacterium]|nr:serine protease [Actinomycetota bacterium]